MDTRNGGIHIGIALATLMNALVGGLAAAVTSSLTLIGIRGYPISWRTHRRQYLRLRLPAFMRAARSGRPISGRSVARMPNDHRPTEKRSAWGDTSSWIVGLLVGLAIGISLGIAMDNLGAGIASGAAIGIVFALAFSQSKKSSSR